MRDFWSHAYLKNVSHISTSMHALIITHDIINMISFMYHDPTILGSFRFNS